MTTLLPQREEVFTIAEGRDRADIEDRAQRAFDHANEVRAGNHVAGGAADHVAARNATYQRARAWASVLSCLDDSGETVFRAADYAVDRPGSPSRLTIISALLDIPAAFSSLSVLFGKRPIAFYTGPGQEA